MLLATELPSTAGAQDVDRLRRSVTTPRPADWRTEWEPEEGFALAIDSRGFQLPSALAFVPNPGPAPKDPLYFVTELRGAVKVVTNDRSVYTFARDFFRLVPEMEIPRIEGEVGLAGICLDPARGYVFVTFAERDSAGALRNAMVRFQSRPRTFSLRPSGQRDLRSVFAGVTSAISHQVGGCQVSGGHVYVSVGDAFQTERSQDTTSVLGKVLRMTVDGDPVKSNPFYHEGPDASRSAGYVWAYGLRNPFGIKAVNARVFVADNGVNIDRFLAVRAGGNYLWDGTDLSIGTRADIVISPPVGPAQLDYAPASSPDAAMPPTHRESFFLALTQPLRPGIMRIPYSMRTGRVTAPPRSLLRYAGERFQLIAGTALGPDGLYLAPMMPIEGDSSVVLRLHFSPGTPHPVSARVTGPLALMETSGCFGCHTLPDVPGGTAGPNLGRDALRQRLEERLDPSRYRAVVARLDTISAEPMASWRDERDAVLRASGREQQLLWTTYKIAEPRFDNPSSAMRNTGLDTAEARTIARFLLGLDQPPRPPTEPPSALARLRALLPAPIRVRHLALFSALAFTAGCVVGGVALAAARRRARR